MLSPDASLIRQERWQALTPEERASGNFGIRKPEFIRSLRANKEGTLLWLLQGATRYIAQPELDAPESVKRYTEEALAGADTERQWFTDGYSFDKVRNKGAEVPFKEIADKWCDAFNVRPQNTSARGKFLKKVRGIVGDAYVVGDSNHGYTILCLKERDA